MGMFDTIHWGESLPFSKEMKDLGLHKNDWSFQTKDLGQCMNEYVFQEGCLFLKKYRINEWVEGTKSKIFLDGLGYLKREQPYLELHKVTQTVSLFDYRNDVKELWDCSIEFEVAFVNGKLKSKKLVSFNKTSNVERKARERKWKEKLEFHNSRWYNKAIFHTSPYIWIRRKVSTCLYKSGSFLHTISYKLP